MIAALAMLTVFVALLGYAVLEAARDARDRWRLEDRIARIAYEKKYLESVEDAERHGRQWK
jgi:cytochrome oxidase Cu insertion factor (SCO1/SenC/PrrC family)